MATPTRYSKRFAPKRDREHAKFARRYDGCRKVGYITKQAAKLALRESPACGGISSMTARRPKANAPCTAAPSKARIGTFDNMAKLIADTLWVSPEAGGCAIKIEAMDAGELAWMRAGAARTGEVLPGWRAKRAPR